MFSSNIVQCWHCIKSFIFLQQFPVSHQLILMGVPFLLAVSITLFLVLLPYLLCNEATLPVFQSIFNHSISRVLFPFTWRSKPDHTRYFFSLFLGLKFRALTMVGKCATTELYLQPLQFFKKSFLSITTSLKTSPFITKFLDHLSSYISPTLSL